MVSTQERFLIKSGLKWHAYVTLILSSKWMYLCTKRIFCTFKTDKESSLQKLGVILGNKVLPDLITHTFIKDYPIIGRPIGKNAHSAQV